MLIVLLKRKANTGLTCDYVRGNSRYFIICARLRTLTVVPTDILSTLESMGAPSVHVVRTGGFACGPTCLIVQ